MRTINTEKDTQSEQKNTSTNVEENQSKPQYLIERIEIPDTPFTVIKTDKQRFITIGQYRISPDLEKEEEPLQWLNDHMWEVITMMASITYEVRDQEKNYPKAKEEPQGDTQINLGI